MLKEIFKDKFRKLLQITIINKEKLIEDIEKEKKYDDGTYTTEHESLFNTGIDKAIEIIKSK